MVLRPEPVFAPSRPSIRPGRSCSWGPVATCSTRPPPGAWPRATASACWPVGTKASTTASASILVDGELSIGDYVLAGGEVAACVVVEAVSRLLPGVMGNECSAERESFAHQGEVPDTDGSGRLGLLEEPQYTRLRLFGVGTSQRSCDQGITPASSAGDGPRRSTGRWSPART